MAETPEGQGPEDGDSLPPEGESGGVGDLPDKGESDEDERLGRPLSLGHRAEAARPPTWSKVQ